MNGDFSRLPFRSSNHYSSVRMQQGRVHLDADWNEQVEIQLHRERITTLDTVGRTGAPLDAAGLGVIGLQGGDAGKAPTFKLSSGRFYVEGIPVEVEESVSVLEQPDLPGITNITQLTTKLYTTDDPATRYLVYVDVWQRHLSALEAPELMEVALGVDTTTRTKTIWQVRLAAIDSDLTCADFGAAWARDFRASTGRLRPHLETTTEPESECLIPPRGGYRRLENQFYRVELHKANEAATLQFKWSRDNGAIASKLKNIRGNIVDIDDPGRDDRIGFASAKWVELLDEERLLNGQPGILVELDGVQGTALMVKAWPDQPPVIDDFTTHRIVRRWDGVGDALPGAPITLEGGLQVEFEVGKEYRAGDYWQIAARSLTGELLWPQTGDSFDYELPHGTHHHYAALALLTWTDAEWTVSDCRTLFPPLTGLIRLFYVSGDGQEAMPGNALPRPLQVAVSNDKFPVQGARVRFRIVGGSGYLSSTSGSGSEQIVLTDEQGIAACSWYLGYPGEGYGDGGDTPVVEAVLLEAGDRVIHPPIRFNANFSVASNVAYDPSNCSRLQQAGASTVQQAIDALCRSQGGGCTVTVGEGGQYRDLSSAIEDLYYNFRQSNLCLCLLPGQHEIGGLEITGPNNLSIRLTISGCGAASELILRERGMSFQNLTSLTLKNLKVDATGVRERNAIQCDRCVDIAIERCEFFHITIQGQSTLHIAEADRVVLESNHFAAHREESLKLLREVFGKFKIFQSFQPDPKDLLRDIAQRIGENPDLRKQLADEINRGMGELEYENRQLYEDFVKILKEEGFLETPFFYALKELHYGAIRSVPGVAIVFADAEANTQILHNTIAGIISFYGYTDGYGYGSGYGYGYGYGYRENNLDNYIYELARLAREGQLSFTGSSTLQMQGNRLTRILVSDDLLQKIEHLLSKDEDQNLSLPLEGVYRTIQFSENLIESGHNQWIGAQVSFLSNTFNIVAGAQYGSGGSAISQSIIFVGNHGPNSNFGLSFAAQDSEVSSNHLITIDSPA